MEDFVLSARRGTVAVLTLNRPQILNAWHRAMRDQLHTLLDRCEEDEGCRAIVLTGAGDRAFGAGQDLNETKTFDEGRAEEWIEEWRALYLRIRTLSKPLICALNGLAAGSAFQVALLCDIRIGHEGSKMGQPEINSGIASSLGPWIMREMLGLSRTTELVLTGRMMSASEAHRIGLIHHLVPADQVMPKALEVADELAVKAPLAMRLNKARLHEMTVHGLLDGLDAGIAMQRESYGSGEPRRLMEAFLMRNSKGLA
jgi:enoyl-CoA hydratase/carnithine racemase